jgi:hypothetical protein
MIVNFCKVSDMPVEREKSVATAFNFLEKHVLLIESILCGAEKTLPLSSWWMLPISTEIVLVIKQVLSGRFHCSTALVPP